MAALASAPARTWDQVTRWCSTTEWGAAGWQRGLVALIAALVFWPQASVDPASGVDPSWQAGLALARAHDLAWGPEIVFTLGPLGFLQNTAYYSFGQSLLASVYQVTVVAVLFLGIATALRQRRAPMTSLIGAFVATSVATFFHIGLGLEAGASLGLMYPELAALAAFAWASVPLLQDDPKRSTAFTVCVALGGVGGFQLLVKINSGPAIVVIALAASVLLGWRAVGRHCATVAAFVLSTLIWWVLAGQRLGDLPTWLKFSASVASGYGDGMAVPLPAVTPMAVPALVVTIAWLGVLCALFVRGRPEIPRRFVALAGLVTVITAKSAFGRFDLWHFSMLLGLIVVAGTITPFSGTRPRALVVAAMTMVLVFVGIVGPAYYFHVVEMLQAPVQAAERLVTLALPGRTGQRVEQARARQRALYAIPDRFIKTIGPGTVHIDPNETSAVWAYDLAWRPPPVFQAYVAYTPALDNLNSESLAKAPQFVLSRLASAAPATSIDNRLGVQESPAYSRALLCNYTVSGTENRWTLFTHSDSHCGPLAALSQVNVRGNGAITVPAPSAPNAAVLVGIDLEPTIVDRLFQGAIAPLTNFTVVLDGATYRLLAANAAQPFLIKTPASVDGTNLQIHAHNISVSCAPSLGQCDTAARLRFYEMPVGP